MIYMKDASGYRYHGARDSPAHGYILPALTTQLDALSGTGERPRLFGVLCGNGSVAAHLSEQVWNVTGVDPSSEGIAAANVAYPDLKLESGPIYDDLAARFKRFPIVYSLEVVGYFYAPKDCAKTLFDLMESGGKAIVSNSYRGYFKNLALANTGKMDAHFTILWDHGHIKFFFHFDPDDAVEGCRFRRHPLPADRARPCACHTDGRNRRQTGLTAPR